MSCSKISWKQFPCKENVLDEDGEGEETSKIVDTISCYELVKTGKASKSKSKSGIF